VVRAYNGAEVAIEIEVIIGVIVEDVTLQETI
jgi:hypothetical protein